MLTRGSSLARTCGNRLIDPSGGDPMLAAIVTPSYAGEDEHQQRYIVLS
jgi:hypothetical protein